MSFDQPALINISEKIKSQHKYEKNSVSLLPGADSHLIRVMYVWTAHATVAFSKAVVVHAILLLLLLLLLLLSDDGEAPLDCTARFRKHKHTTGINSQWSIKWSNDVGFTEDTFFGISAFVPSHVRGYWVPYANFTFKKRLLAVLLLADSDERPLIMVRRERRLKCKSLGWIWFHDGYLVWREPTGRPTYITVVN